jgi:hypothetical protein
MTWSKDLTTPYHQQDTDYYCGAAVAQMILDSIGAGILDQNMLYNMNHSHLPLGAGLGDLAGWLELYAQPTHAAAPDL